MRPLTIAVDPKASDAKKAKAVGARTIWPSARRRAPTRTAIGATLIPPCRSFPLYLLLRAARGVLHPFERAGPPKDLGGSLIGMPVAPKGGCGRQAGRR